jgi:LacI family fructose operon transcriptional repressor
MLSWQVDWVVATGATNPDKISALCQQAGVPTVNLDLPGTLSPSVISDNYGGAKALTHKILATAPAVAEAGAADLRRRAQQRP